MKRYMEKLKQIEDLAGLAFSPEEIGIVLEDSSIVLDVMQADGNEVYQAYMRGKLKKQAEIRKAINDLARNGSHPAQQMMVSFFEKQKREE